MNMYVHIVRYINVRSVFPSSRIVFSSSMGKEVYLYFAL